MQKVSEIVITVYATIFYVLASKFGSLLPFSKMISQNFRVNLLVVQSIIFGFMSYIFFRIGHSILGLRFGHEAFSVGAQDENSENENGPPPLSKQEIRNGLKQNAQVRDMRSRRLARGGRASQFAKMQKAINRERGVGTTASPLPGSSRSFADNRVNLNTVGGLR